MCFGATVHDVINSLQSEVPSHELNDRSQTHHTGTDTDASETGFSNWCVNDSSVAEFLPHAFRYFVGTVVTRYLFTD
jgi:hypothetical protein